MAGATDSYLTLKGKIDFPAGVLVIGSHTQMDNQKEKVMLMQPVPHLFALFIFLIFFFFFFFRRKIYVNFLLFQMLKSGLLIVLSLGHFFLIQVLDYVFCSHILVACILPNLGAIKQLF